MSHYAKKTELVLAVADEQVIPPWPQQGPADEIHKTLAWKLLVKCPKLNVFL